MKRLHTGELFPSLAGVLQSFFYLKQKYEIWIFPKVNAL